MGFVKSDLGYGWVHIGVVVQIGVARVVGFGCDLCRGFFFFFWWLGIEVVVGGGGCGCGRG